MNNLNRGWYADPDGSGNYRYWNGTRWVSQTNILSPYRYGMRAIFIPATIVIALLFVVSVFLDIFTTLGDADNGCISAGGIFFKLAYIAIFMAWISSIMGIAMSTDTARTVGRRSVLVACIGLTVASCFLYGFWIYLQGSC